jgi:uncharacterized membrane protein (DUF2068 family)
MLPDKFFPRKRLQDAELRLVAAIEAGKGLLVLATAIAIFRHIHANVQELAEELIRHFHLNPASHYPRIFLDLASHLNDRHLLILGIGAMAYAVIRFAEAFGLWHGKHWAWLFGMVSAGIYVPIEIAELAEHASWAGITVLAINILVLFILWLGRRSSTPRSDLSPGN